MGAQLRLDSVACQLKRCPGHTGDEAWHGTLAGYNHHRCRCDRCSLAKAGRSYNPTTYKAWAAANLARKLANNAAWRLANPGRYAELQREGQGRRRARKRATRCEPYSVRDIYERDGWICQLCGDPVDPAAVFPDPMVATIDHEIPICQGGADAPDNVRLAHLRCNQRRPQGPRHTRKEPA